MNQRAVAAFMLVFVWAPFASAHQIGLSRGEYTTRGNELDAEIVFAKGEKDRAISVVADGEPCSASSASIEPTEDDGIRVRQHFACPSRPSLVRLEFLKGDATHLARIDGRDAVFDASDPQIRLRETGQGTLLWMGIRHILTGWDHLAFLIGLVIVGGRWRSILGAVTAFTLAHSITLGLAALGVVEARPIFVEPAIALSVLYVGVENFRVSSTAGRWKITLPFGLIHGFGFAGALRALDLPRPRVPLALLSFNGGVEIGQLAVLAVVLPLLWLLGKSMAFRKWGVRGISALIAAAGAIWFVARLAC